MIYNGIDIEINDSGDIVIGEDIKIVKDSKAFEQNIKNRIYTIRGEIPLHKEIETNLGMLEGMPNTRETANIGEQDIIRSLKADFEEYSSGIRVIAFPIEKNKIMYLLQTEIYDFDSCTYTKIIKDINVVL